ncbi:MAG: IS1 family transposase [Saprospiraceae bacterium]|jgi:transposase-like protein|nr:IS1 family transposase [Saprospiraceae bacterium]
MIQPVCPKCKSEHLTRSGVVKMRQRYHCKKCDYYFTVLKDGKSIDPYFIIKAFQLYLEGLSYREIERILGISHVSVMNWVKKYNIRQPDNFDYKPTYKVVDRTELLDLMSQKEFLKSAGCIITELGDKFMLIKWERFRKSL